VGAAWTVGGKVSCAKQFDEMITVVPIKAAITCGNLREVMV
jgi:hypothetical protein